MDLAVEGRLPCVGIAFDDVDGVRGGVKVPFRSNRVGVGSNRAPRQVHRLPLSAHRRLIDADNPER